jgi:tetratricopeptide (TPR) repeat protein
LSKYDKFKEMQINITRVIFVLLLTIVLATLANSLLLSIGTNLCALEVFNHLHGVADDYAVRLAKSDVTFSELPCRTRVESAYLYYQSNYSDLISKFPTLSHQSDDKFALYFFGMAYLRINQPNLAMSMFRQLGTGLPFYIEGESLEDIGEISQAEKLYNLALEISPNLEQAHIAIASINDNRGNYDDAFKHWQEAAMSTSVPNDAAFSWIRAGRAASRSGLFELALISYDKSIASATLSKLQAQAIAEKGSILRQLGKIDEAISAYNDALSLVNNPGWGLALARLYESEGLSNLALDTIWFYLLNAQDDEWIQKGKDEWFRVCSSLDNKCDLPN